MDFMDASVQAAAVEEATEAGMRRVRLLNTAVNQVVDGTVPDIISSNRPVLQRAPTTEGDTGNKKRDGVSGSRYH